VVNEITDIGVQFLADALDNPTTNLQYLDLSKNKFITDLSLIYFEHMIKHNRSLNELSVYQCNLSQIGKEKIQKEAKSKKNFCVYVNTWNN
jgi:Ran GTPase-activating protein (RanGAP) involved in mRNA processing and transport